jgi:hypothetical protein
VIRIGLISDTHGLVRPEALRWLEGSDAIVHAGDIGSPDVLRALQALAPLHAIRGNNDTQTWAANLPDTLALEFGGARLFVLHDLHSLGRHAPPPGTQVVVCGHSHKPLVQSHAGGFVVVNPGSAGPRRFKLPVGAGEIRIDARGHFEAKLADLL